MTWGQLFTTRTQIDVTEAEAPFSQEDSCVFLRSILNLEESLLHQEWVWKAPTNSEAAGVLSSFVPAHPGHLHFTSDSGKENM